MLLLIIGISTTINKKIKKVYDKYNELDLLVEKAYETAKTLTLKNFTKEVFYGLFPEFKG